jgi:hypothetical protein
VPPPRSLLSLEGLAVGALLLSGVHLMGTHLDVLQRAVVSAVAMVGALLYGAADALVGVGIHINILLFIEFKASMSQMSKLIHRFLAKYCILKQSVLFYRKRNEKEISYGKDCPFYSFCGFRESGT